MLIFSILSYLVSAKLQIFIDGQSKNLNYSLANFGHIPYGRTLGGFLIAPKEIEDNQLDLCNKSNLQPLSDQGNVWIVARIGNCSATTKAYVAQELGAQLLVIISNKVSLTNGMELNNDGMGFKVHIPTIEISKSDGEQILKETASSEDPRQYAIISFNDSKKVEKPEVILFITLNDKAGFKFIREFQQYYKILEKKVKFSISFEVEVNKRDKRLNFTQPNDQCMGGGRYCMQSRGDGQGRLIIEEQLRQHCIWINNETQWFEYMDYFDKNCFKVLNYAACSSESQIAQQKVVKDCVENSYEKDSKKAKELKENTIMDYWVGNKSLSGIIYFPGVLVNGKPYHGNLEAESVTEDICSNMLDQSVCSALQQSEDDSPNSGSEINWAMIAFAVVSCILFGLFLFMCYRRRLKMQMQQELGQQVNEMVSQYIKFYETKNEK
ncbi:unnamed protein product (macronuclear) [Paramecium tetraurelia]|uniref:Uncharacterized protein n=1 Tax=Paramecium tetraurelia TaxID=5888 RepID=A0C178_PARTE|nr:uncharacterized protein GSPATT00034021001 [Paramecium tetraurelia]CAK64545.1 unnamed protein product [Paramecium tetraurelia]|eukprot:XP_001431943.1 hypothetical protein (macronuclear) [Paramecium tetraurelia strain d4-2]